ncbi:MAG TPA: hypothetical protein VLT15_05780 [Acidimicrobiia bacterium]|nr:hypothetical protein [Acidimicrobiia bacterium]
MGRTLSVCPALGLPAPTIGYACEQHLKIPEVRQIDYVDDAFEPKLDADHPAAQFDVDSQAGAWLVHPETNRRMGRPGN